MRPLTLTVPKPLLQFGSVHRLLDFTLDNIVGSRVRQTYVLTQYLAESVGDYLRARQEPLRDSLTRVIHQPPVSGKRYRSTGDAVGQNLALASGDADLILILSADHIYRMDYRRLLADHVQRQADVTVGAVPVPRESATEFGVLSVDSTRTILDFAEKPESPEPIPGMDDRALASMGIYVFNRRCLALALADLSDRVPRPDFGKDLIPYLVARGKVSAYLATDGDGNPEYWRDVGTIESYYHANMDMLAGQPAPEPSDSHWILPPAKASREPAYGVRANSIIAASALLGDCSVEQSILSPGASVDDGADVFGSILLPGAHVGRGARVRNAIIDNYGEVSAGDEIGYSRAKDRERFDATESGIVVVAARRREQVRVVSNLSHYRGAARYATSSRN